MNAAFDALEVVLAVTFLVVAFAMCASILLTVGAFVMWIAEEIRSRFGDDR